MKKRIALVAGLPAALLALSACTTYDSYGYGGGYGYGGYDSYGGGYYGDRYDDTYYGGGGLGYYDGWYDNHYGPVYGGYWAPDGYFWYQSRLGGPYVRDHYRHFRRDRWGGASHFRFPNRRDHDGGWDRERDRNRNTPRLFEGQNRDRNWNNDRDRNWNNDRNNTSPAPRNRDNANGGPRRGNDNDRGDRGRDGGNQRRDSGGNRSDGAQESRGERRTPSLWGNRPN